MKILIIYNILNRKGYICDDEKTKRKDRSYLLREHKREAIKLHKSL